MAKGKTLFLGHDASRTGAPLLLLEIIRWLGMNSTLEMEVYLKRGGGIECDYSRLAPTFCPRGKSQCLLRKGLRKLRLIGDKEPNLASRYPVERYPVVYANTIATCQTAMGLADPKRRIIQHIHEMSYATDVYRAKDILRSAVPHTDVYIAVSGAVRDFLIDDIQVPSEKIRVIHGFPIAGPLQPTGDGTGVNVRLSHRIPADAFVVGMCGSPEWRKGTDVFVRLAQQVRDMPEGHRCHFVWLGGESDAFLEFQLDVDKLGLRNVCHFVPAVEDPSPYFKAFDLFALTSREDPFPLVMLEAAASGLPIVCFAQSGGATELVEADAGIIVPYLDVQAMARACVDLLMNEEKRKRFGAEAKVKVEGRYLLAQQGPKIRAVIESVFESIPGSRIT